MPTAEASLGDFRLRKQVSAPAFRAFVDAVGFLHLDVSEALKLLGDLPSTTYCRYVSRGAPKLGRDLLERISLVLGIIKGLRLVFVDDEAGRCWLRGANTDPPFGGKSPLDYALQGSIAHLYGTRVSLDVWRVG